MREAISGRYPSSRNSRFMIGRDAQGHWLVCDVKGLVGGIFRDRSTAIHFASAESGYAPGDVCCAHDDAVLSMDPLFKPVPIAHWPDGVRPL